MFLISSFISYFPYLKCSILFKTPISFQTPISPLFHLSIYLSLPPSPDKEWYLSNDGVRAALSSAASTGDC